MCLEWREEKQSQNRMDRKFKSEFIPMERWTAFVEGDYNLPELFMKPVVIGG